MILAQQACAYRLVGSELDRIIKRLELACTITALERTRDEPVGRMTGLDAEATPGSMLAPSRLQRTFIPAAATAGINVSP